MTQRKLRKSEPTRATTERRVIEDFKAILIGKKPADPFLDAHFTQCILSLAAYLKSLTNDEERRLQPATPDDIPF